AITNARVPVLKLKDPTTGISCDICVNNIYVLMCIHFLQQRWPAILPCLQRMGTTYSTTAEDIECSYFDRVKELRNFGIRNRENLSQLVWAFFHYWAYCHDYVNDVISVRTGDLLSKREKGWTIRVGNDRHLMCIEDPFDVYRDLGRFVDRSTLRIIRQEFERAAEIMQYDSQPFVALFEPYPRPKPAPTAAPVAAPPTPVAGAPSPTPSATITPPASSPPSDSPTASPPVPPTSHCDSVANSRPPPHRRPPPPTAHRRHRHR
ncbi:hypothetical protein MIMGU_mgv1a026745mg, partial [Erythranthe guttata]